MVVSPIPTVNTTNYDLLKIELREFDLMGVLDTSTLPYTDFLGNIFWILVWGAVFIAYWIRTGNANIPSIIALICGGIFIVMIPEVWQPAVRGLIALAVLTSVYLNFVER